VRRCAPKTTRPEQPCCPSWQRGGKLPGRLGGSSRQIVVIDKRLNAHRPDLAACVEVRGAAIGGAEAWCCGRRSPVRRHTTWDAGHSRLAQSRTNHSNTSAAVVLSCPHFDEPLGFWKRDGDQCIMTISDPDSARGRRPPRNTNDPQHWRDRAAQIRALALTLNDSEVVILMNDLAADYEKIANRAAIKADARKPPANGQPR